MDSLLVSTFGQEYSLDSLVVATYGYASSVIKADFSVDISAAVGPFLVHFTDHSIPQGEIDSYDWDFGDGSAIDHTIGNVTHTYSSLGEHVATLTIHVGSATSTASLTIYVASVVPAEVIQSSVECREDLSMPVKFWDYLSVFWNHLNDDDREMFENFWYSMVMASDSMIKKATRFYNAIGPESAWTCVLDDFTDVKMGYLYSRPIDLDPTKKEPNSTISPVALVLIEPTYSELVPVFQDMIDINSADYYAIRSIALNAWVIVTPKDTTIPTKYFKVVNLVSSEEPAGPRHVAPTNVGRYSVIVSGNLSYLENQKFTIQFTTGLAYPVDPTITDLPTLQNFIVDKPGTIIRNGVDYIFDDNVVEFAVDPIDNGMVNANDYLYCPKANAAEQYLYSLYGTLVDYPDWNKYDTQNNIAGKAAVCGLMLSLQDPTERVNYERALNIYYGLPIAPENCRVVGLYESYEYPIININTGTSVVTLEIPSGSILSGLIQVGGRMLCPGKCEMIVTARTDGGLVTFNDVSKISVGDVLNVKLTNRYSIFEIGLDDDGPHINVVSPDSEESIDYLHGIYAANVGILPEILVYGTGLRTTDPTKTSGWDGVYHIAEIDEIGSAGARIEPYVKGPTDEALYNDFDITNPPVSIQKGFVHIPWPTHKFLYLRLDSQRYFKAYLDSPIDTIYDTGDRLNQYDVIARSISVIGKNQLPGWNQFDQLKPASGVNLESDVVELVNIIPGAKFGQFL